MKKPQSYVADFSVTNFTAEISSAWLIIVYHDNAEKDTEIVRVFVQFANYILDIKQTHSTCFVLGKLSNAFTLTGL